MQRVVALALDRVVAFDLATPAQVFGHNGGSRYRFALAGVSPGPVATSTGFAVVADHGVEALAVGDTIVVPGYDDVYSVHPAAALNCLRASHVLGARVVLICTGPFPPAQPSLLDVP